MDRLDAGFAAYEANALAGEDWADDCRRVASDAFFYFVCWHQVGRMMHLFWKKTGDPAVGNVCEKHRSELDKYAGARHRIQHVDSRTPGKRLAHEISPSKEIWYPGGIAPFIRQYEIGRVQYDISRKSFELLDKIVGDFNAASELHVHS